MRYTSIDGVLVPSSIVCRPRLQPLDRCECLRIVEHYDAIGTCTRQVAAVVGVLNVPDLVGMISKDAAGLQRECTARTYVIRNEVGNGCGRCVV